MKHKILVVGGLYESQIPIYSHSVVLEYRCCNCYGPWQRILIAHSPWKWILPRIVNVNTTQPGVAHSNAIASFPFANTMYQLQLSQLIFLDRAPHCTVAVQNMPFGHVLLYLASIGPCTSTYLTSFLSKAKASR